MRLIDVDALEHEILSKHPYMTRDTVLDVAYLVHKFPAVGAVPNVLCRDCKYWHESTGYCDQHSYFVGADGMSCSPAESPCWTTWDADDFCSYGERKDGDT